MRNFRFDDYYNEKKRILITGGSGFIGSNLIRKLLLQTKAKLFNLDKLSYASDETSLEKFLVQNNLNIEDRYKFINSDLSNINQTKKAIFHTQPDIIFHLAAESHVDRSIDNPAPFIESNIIGTFNLLESSRIFYKDLSPEKKKIFKFHHISTDEVFGSLGQTGKFNEKSLYDPRSPYSASKASSDHLVSAWFHSFNLPVLVTNCSNNYGPRQFPEKLIPNIIFKALNNQKIPIYGDGKNIRDWIYVDDHIEALLLVNKEAKAGKKYCIGGSNERSNLELCKLVCNILDKLRPSTKPYRDLITFVEDRPGHDKRYSIDNNLIETDFSWAPKYSLEEGLNKTIKWYLENEVWCNYIKRNSDYNGERLGLFNKK